MKREYVVLALMLLVLALPPAVGCGTSTTATTLGEVQGAAVFASYCGTCHGFRGEGGSGPDLRVVASKDKATVENQVMNGKGTMPGFSDKLSAGQITAVVDYVLELQR